MNAERQIVGRVGEHELGHDQRGDDPVKRLRDRAIARRVLTIWHTSGSKLQTASSLARQRGRKLVFKSVLGVPFLCCALAACGAPRLRQGSRKPRCKRAGAFPPVAALPTASTRLSPSCGILVYRAGPLAHFGHNHVMVNRQIRGQSMWQIAAALSASHFG